MRGSFISATDKVGCAGLMLLLLAVACTQPSGALPLDNSDEAFEPPSADGAFSDFIVGGDTTGQRVAAGAEAPLPEGGAVTLPQGSPAEIDVGVTYGGLTQEASDGFQELFPEATRRERVLQITIRADAGTPDYLILTLPASDPTSRLFIAGYIDEDTSQLAWEALDTRFDAATGRATALVGWEQFGPVRLAQSATQKHATAMSASDAVVYTGHVAIGVGGQSFDGEVMFQPVIPDGPMTVAMHEPPILVSAYIGLRLSRITNQPLESLAVTSGFGPRDTNGLPAGASPNHKGVDYFAEVGTFVYAAGDGVVRRTRCDSRSVACGPRANGNITGGYIVEIDHGNGEVTHYMHLTEPAIVHEDQRVIGGQPIAFSGNTGGVSAHLHFELRKNGVPVNPAPIFNQQVTATLAMAIDNHLVRDTGQQITLTRGMITEENMEFYGSPVDVAGLSLGRHKLQFVLIEPRRRLNVLFEAPLNVVKAVISGRERLINDVKTPLSTSSGSFDMINDRKEFNFTLIPADDLTLEGNGHITYSLNRHSFRPNSGCPDTTSSASVEWDVVLLGTYSRQEDGSIDVTFFSTPSAGPRFLFTQDAPGCPEKTFKEELSGESSPTLSAKLIDGRYYSRSDGALDTGEEGEYFYEVFMSLTE